MDALEEALVARDKKYISDKEYRRIRRAYVSSLERRASHPEAAQEERRKGASAPQQPALKKAKVEPGIGTKKKACAPPNCGSSSHTQHLAIVERDGFPQQQSTPAGCRWQSESDGNRNGVECAAPDADVQAGKGLNKSVIPNMRWTAAVLSNFCNEPGKSCTASKDARPASETETTGQLKKKPKKTKSAYLFFLVQKRSEVKEKYPDLDNTSAMKQLGMMWRQASDAEKAPFVAMAEKDKIRYEKEKATASAAARRGAPPASTPAAKAQAT